MCVYARIHTWVIHMTPTRTYVQSDVCYDLILHTFDGALYICTLHTYTHESHICTLHQYTNLKNLPYIHTHIHMYPTHKHILLHACDMSHFQWCVCAARVCGTTRCVRWLIHGFDITHLYVRRDSFVRATCLICTCDMTHLYVRRDSFVCATWLTCTCDVTHLYVRHDSFVRATWLTCTCNMTHLYVRHDLHTGHELSKTCVGYICVTRVCMSVRYICKIHQHVYDCIITYVWLDTGHELSLIASTPATYIRQDDCQVSHAS